MKQSYSIPTTKHFNPVSDPKMVCTCCGGGGLSITILILLELLKQHFNGKAVIIHSGARCAKHNAQEGGAKNSEHKFTEEEPLVDVADIHIEGVSPQELYMFVKSLPFANLLGIGKYKTFVHVDTRGYAARW